MGTLWSAAPLTAQVTYSVFPAKAPTVNTAVAQPTNHDTGSSVTLIVQDSTIDFIVNAIARQAHLRAVYTNGDPIFAKRITVRITNASVSDAFAASLRGTGLMAKVTSDGETVVIRAQSGLSLPKRARSAGGIVTGRVTDSASGRGLSGVTIKVAGTNLMTVTADDGHFTLWNVTPGDRMLTARLFGYRPVERLVTVIDSQSTTVRITMIPVATVLSGVVTTATGLQRKIEVGNDITSINVDSVMRVAPITSVTDLLETRVPGLTVLHSSGVPGDPSRIRLRGVSSITGNNDPIVIVDGVRVYASQSDARNNNLAPHSNSGGGSSSSGQSANGFTNDVSTYAAPSPLDQIDPSSIETIEVFKGPSASALYGSDAANGVIVITTKHGHAGPTQWNVALGQGVNWLPGSWPVNYYRFGEDGTGLSKNFGGLCQWFDPNCKVDSIVPYQALNDPRYSVFSHGQDQTGSLTVSGGVSTLQYSFTGSGASDVGNLKLPAIEQQRYEQFYGPIPKWMVRPDNYQTWGLSGQVSAQPSATARVTVNSSLYNSNQQRSSLEQAITQLGGKYINNGELFGILSIANGAPNSLTNTPLLQNELERATAGSLTSTNALTVAWQPMTWLPLTATGGLNIMQRNDQTLIPFGIQSTGPGPTGIGLDVDTTGSFGLGHGTSQDKTLNIGTTIPTLHNRVTIGVGGNWNNTSTTDVTAYTNQLSPGVSLPSQFLTTGCNTPSNLPCSSFSQASAASSTYGWFVEPRLNLSSRFFAAPGFRLDGGSASGANAGLTALPKIDLSYVMVDQSHPRGIVSLFRPRLAFGYAGTQPGPTDKLRLLNVGGGTVVTLNDTTTLPSVDISKLGNTQLQPEISSEVEAGFDAELGSGRFVLTYTQYNKTRRNAIISLPVAPSVFGPQTFNENIGVVRNTGTELTLTTQLIQSRALSWTVGGNLSNNANKLVRLAPSFTPNKQLGIVAGFPLFSDWQFPIVSFVDLNHDKIIEPNEIRLGDSLIYVGQADPKYQLNLNTWVTFLNGRLSVNATFAYQNGMTQDNQVAINSGAVNFIASAPGTPLATQAAVVAATQGAKGHGTTQIGMIQTVNTFRFNDLSINYTLPKMVSQWFRIPSASLALQGSNLGLHTNYRGKDPNVNAFSTVGAVDETADLGQIPQPRTWWLKLSLGN